MKKIHRCEGCSFLQRFDFIEKILETDNSGMFPTVVRKKTEKLDKPIYMCLNFAATEYGLNAISAYFKYVKGVDFQPEFNNIKPDLRTPEFCPKNNAETVKILDRRRINNV